MNSIIRNSLFALCCCATTMPAHVTTATYYATVTDASGAVIPSAKVVLIHDGTGTTSEKITDPQGEAVFPFLRVGAYTIRADAKSFKRQKSTDVELTNPDGLLNPITFAVGTLRDCNNPVEADRWVNLGPRIGFSFDPQSNGKMAIRGGFGILFSSQVTGALQAAVQPGPNTPFRIRFSRADSQRISRPRITAQTHALILPV